MFLDQYYRSKLVIERRRRGAQESGGKFAPCARSTVERKVAGAYARAELANAAKSRFLAMASHDLRQQYMH